MNEILKRYNILNFKCKEFGNGYINDTYKVETENGTYLLQRINHEIFKNPEQLMKNFRKICDYLKNIVSKENGNIDRETLTIIKDSKGNDFVELNGNYYRLLKFIDNSFSYDVIENSKQFYLTGLAFGKFQKQLKDFPVEELYETIKNFHHTPTRFETFLKAIEENKSNRKHLVEDEIKFILDRKDEVNYLVNLLENKKIKLTVTHNDTKLSNILIDKETLNPLCIVDLDTIMPGVVAYDFGDAIRSGACFSLEDETDLSKVYIDLDLYENFTKGFLEGLDNSLSNDEIDSLIWGGKIITFEQAIRFLTDYLDGDLYYKTKYPNHNLDRARTQLKLVKDTEEKWDSLKSIFEKYKKCI